ncbi:calmodulin-regulated spectrin-associated protein 1-like isoform X3 [Mya arenaria]|uniref:calmodulin-regulated spectrin-associated protein 1-like isoform X3 n=1 Tax=Mya arenaria TaxID=6604 RepID=UPI0022E20678|nr:calmodulin-regulated spectrin-associated protein 1-like isoform X3 [Mya arenaria]
MDSWQSDGADDSDGEIVEIIPVEEYDVQKAKAQASLSWLLGKAYQDKVPTEFQQPFYDTGEGVWHVKPRLANLLASSELYCQACRHMFGENASQWTGHWSIIQVLSRKGIYAGGSDSGDVTETILMQSAPFKLKAHIALIDALMTAFSQEILTVERVTQTVRRFATFNASSELPGDVSDAALFWVNKVCVTVQRHLEATQSPVIEGGETSQKVRIVSARTPRESISVPILESLVEDIGDGCSMATLLSFYCPQILNIDDVCLKTNVGIADSLYNLRLVKTFCQRHLPHRTWHFTFEDLLYTHATLTVNIIMMLAEFFYWFEIKTLPIVTGAGLNTAAGGKENITRPQSSSVPRVANVPSVSNVTKASFQRVRGDSELRASSTPDLNKMSPSSSAPPPHRAGPLLHKRHETHGRDGNHLTEPQASVQRANSLTSHDLRRPAPPRESIVAWPEKGHGQTGMPSVSLSHAGINLLANVSIDSDLGASFSSTSIDLGDLGATPRTDRSQFDHPTSQQDGDGQGNNVISFSLMNKKGTPFPTQNQTPVPEDLELESVNSCTSRHGEYSQRGDSVEPNVNSLIGGNLEPLLPARLKPAKEKGNNHSKEEERDETPKRKTPSPPKVKKKVNIDPHLAIINNSQSCDIEQTVTPTNESQNLSVDFNLSPYTQSTQAEGGYQLPHASDHPDNKKFEAFFVRGSVTESEDNIPTHRSDITVAESYVVNNCDTPEAARAAGIPIIDETETSPHRRLSREGSVASSKSSGDFSDHESHKIHADHKTRESLNKIINNNDIGRIDENALSDPSRFIIQKPVIMSRVPRETGIQTGPKGQATSFSQIKHMKQLGQIDNSGFVYMQHGQDESKGRPTSLRDAFQRKAQEKKSPLGSGSGDRQELSQSEATGDSSAENGAVSQELIKIKMKLEEKRKAIERKKHTQEIQQQKMRQRLGKAAFLHVVAKPKDDSEATESNHVENGAPPARMTLSDPQLPLAPANMSPQLISPAHQQSPRHRGDIQKTIENVRKNWFNEADPLGAKAMDRSECESPEQSQSSNGVYFNRDDEMQSSQESQGSQSSQGRRPVFDRRSTSVERVSSLAESFRSPQDIESPHRESPSRGFDRRSGSKERSVSSQQQPVSQPFVPASAELQLSRAVPEQMPRGEDVERRSVSVERSPRPEARKEPCPRVQRSGSYDEYNHSIDKLNQSLTDLQGEIMKLSLKQIKQRSEAAKDQRSRSKSPPNMLDVRQKTMPERDSSEGEGQGQDERSRSLQPTNNLGQARSSSEPRQVQQENEQIGHYNSSTLPRPLNNFPQGHGHLSNQPFMMQHPASVAGLTGPVYGSPSQYIPSPGQAGMPPTAQQYGSYIMGPGGMPQYQHSPPQMYSPGVHSMYQGHPGQPYPGAQHIVSPQSQQPIPYSTVYSSPTTHFQPVQPLAATYTTSAHQHVAYTPPSSHPANFLPASYPPQQQQVLQTGIESLPMQPVQTGSSQVNQSRGQPNVTTDSLGSTAEVSQPYVPKSDRQMTNDNTEADQNGFFVSMNEGSPRRMKAKPQLSDRRAKNDSFSSDKSDSSNKTSESVETSNKTDTNKYGSSVIADFAQDMSRGQDVSPAAKAPGGDTSVQEPVADTSHQSDTSAVGFVIGQDESTLDQSAEEEMQRRKEKLEKMRLKRQEEAEKKRLRLEQEAARRREAEQMKQDESERRKSSDKARREAIFQQYISKKEEDDDSVKPRTKQKPRPKSMFVKGGPDFTEGGASSTEDLSSRASVEPAGQSSNATSLSMNTLHNGGGDGKPLAYGGLTHRRPPSPDLYRTRKGPRSNEGSETGSAHGSEYSGPKLFVRPSAKSNRHIITNAISHCCLAGIVNTDQKNKVLEEIAKSNAKHFIILFRDASCGYRSLYGFDPDTEDCVKIIGVGPRFIQHDMVEKYFKYNSGAKSFSEVVSTKHISVSIDAISLQNSVWKPLKPPAKANR